MSLNYFKFRNHQRLANVDFGVHDFLARIDVIDAGKTSHSRCPVLLLEASIAKPSSHVLADDCQATN